MAAAAMIQVTGLGKEKLARLKKQAERLGLSAERYARQLIEDGLSLDEQARTKSFDHLFAPAQARFHESGMTEGELDRLVDAARDRHHQRTSRKKL